jgi:hypothetical protein
MRDPLVMDPYTSVPDPGQDAPLPLLALQVVNVAVNALTLAVLARLLSKPPNVGDAAD